MICTLNQLEVLGIKDGILSNKYDTFLGAFAYCLACGYVSGDPCWAEAWGARDAVNNTIKFLKIKYGDKGIVNEFNNTLCLLGYKVLTCEEGIYKFTTTGVRNIKSADPEFSSHYHDNLEFREFIDNIRYCSSTHVGGFSSSCHRLSDYIFEKNKSMKFLESFKTIINNFISERHMYVAKDDRINRKLFEMCA